MVWVGYMGEKNNLLKSIEDTAILLYQNKEHEGVAKVAELLPLLQNIIQNMTEEQIKKVGDFAWMMLKELVQNYNCQDMLAMADGLMVKAMLLVQYIEETNG